MVTKTNFVLKLFLVNALALVLGSCFKKKLTTDGQLASYSLGFSAGQSLSGENNLDEEALVAGFRDGLHRKSQFEESTLQQARQNFQSHRVTGQLTENEKRQREEVEFLKRNHQKNKKINELPSRLQFETLKEGTGRLPKRDETLQIHVIGKLLDGDEFENTYKKKIPLEVGQRSNIQAWNEVLPKMKEGEIRRLYVPAHLGYGAGTQPRVPPYSTLIFDLELVKVVPVKVKPAPIGQLPVPGKNPAPTKK